MAECPSEHRHSDWELNPGPLAQGTSQPRLLHLPIPALEYRLFVSSGSESTDSESTDSESTDSESTDSSIIL